ncbi:thiazole synthase [Natronocella acetinitrilica]|uniref:Thiazole synthase n=1 Tax=Natronocella acetinitrilica TaxID=414046 RepID=A0AAE3KI53_9GAMM|nr:thiazole synthase [Natronocella acetinitrilica]MCP1677032.1 thiazole synthase [Natronocella acetinitrilica]
MIDSDKPLKLAGREYQSRLLLGTGRYKDLDETRRAVSASGSEIVTVAIRRLPDTAGGDALLPALRELGCTILPNTAGCYTVEDAVYTCQLARELLDGETLCKLEVIGCKETLQPDTIGTLKAAEQLIRDGFHVMAYTTDDPLIAKELGDMGCTAVMPLGAPIGSGLGIQNRLNIRRIVETCAAPVLVDAGVGTASDAAIAMELGCDAVLLNTAVAEANDPERMAAAMKHAVIAGRHAYLAGRMPARIRGVASSPLTGTLNG